MRQVRRALLSVWDKRGVVELARALHSFGCELISTGGTGRVLRDAALPVTDIATLTGNPEAFGGRMKTISFAVESALLFDRERDGDEAARLGITAIDMVVCNLYPFEAQAEKGADAATLVEQIDVGGPTMLRAAAKNCRFVAAVTEPEDYPAIIRELAETGGALCEETRLRLMRKAFWRTARYDACIAAAMDERGGELSLSLAFEQGQKLRYGENPHQGGWLYRRRGAACSICDLELLSGKELSFNNMADLAAAAECVRELSDCGCAVVKHLNPCGLAEGKEQGAVLAAAWEGDPISAFGSVIAFNRPLTLAAARFFELDSQDKGRRKYVEVVCAPAFEAGVTEYLAAAVNLRVVLLDPAALAEEWDMRFVPGGLLVQDPDAVEEVRSEFVTRVRPERLDAELLRFGVVAVSRLRSNAIGVVRRMEDGTMQLVGMGAGQPNRVVSTRLAVEKARDCVGAGTLADCYLVSDAFFPFPDSVEVAAEAGVKVLFQPGGSVRDRQVVKRCDELGVAMGMTGRRHFRH